MSTQNQIIAFCIIGVLAIPLGTYTTIKLIKKLTRPPVNTLVSSGDLELVDIIEPVRPQQIYNYPDLLEQGFPTNYYGRVSSYFSGTPPSYFSGTPPSYHTVNRGYINSAFENGINLDYIFWFILICVFVFTIRYVLISKKWIKNTIINPILIILLGIMYIQFGLLVLSQIIILFIILILSNSLLGLNPYNIWLHVIKWGSIILIISILHYNSSYILISTTLMIPFSTFEIDFRDSFEWKINSYKVKPTISYLKLQSLTKDINLLKLSLADDLNYSMSLSFISSYKKWEEDKETNYPLFIDDAIIINKESDSQLITQFIMENLDKKGYFITDWLFNDSLINSLDPVILTVTIPIEVIKFNS